MTELLLADAFTLWGSPTTWLEIIAFMLALATPNRVLAHAKA